MSDIVQEYRYGRSFAPLDIHASPEEMITHAVLASTEDNLEFVFAIAEEENGILGENDQACLPYQVQRLQQIHERFTLCVGSRVYDSLLDAGFKEDIDLTSAHVTKHGTLYVQYI